MTANRSQYMILDADDSNMERRGRQNTAYTRQPALPSIRDNFSPDNSTLEEIAREQHPDDSARETRQRVQLMRQHLENRRVTYRSERHEVVFDAVETSPPPCQATPIPPSPPPAITETRPTWVMKL